MLKTSPNGTQATTVVKFALRPTADGDLLDYSAVASEPLESASKAPAAEVAASSCLRRAAALAGLGLDLWG